MTKVSDLSVSLVMDLSYDFDRRNRNALNMRKNWISANRYRIKCAVYVVCTTLCIYQLTAYFVVYFSYETAVDTDVLVQRVPKIPATTICYNPNVLYDYFCNKSKEYCSMQNAPRGDDAQAFTSRPENFVDVLYECKFRSVQKDTIIPNDLCGSAWISSGYEPCVVNSVFWGSPLNVSENYTEFKLGVQMPISVEFNMAGKRDYGIDIFVHSAYIVPNRNIRSFYLTFGKTYKIVFSKTVVYRLEAPYKTNCFDYRRLLKKRRKFQNVSADTCYYYCLWTKFKEKCNCIPTPIAFVNGYVACNSTQKEKCPFKNGDEMSFIKKECRQNCPTSCRMEHFDYNVVQLGKIRDKPTLLDIFQELRGHTIIIFTHRPRIRSMDIFSSIGGFVGIWLGLSVPQLSDIITNAVTRTFFNIKLKILAIK